MHLQITRMDGNKRKNLVDHQKGEERESKKRKVIMQQTERDGKVSNLL